MLDVTRQAVDGDAEHDVDAVALYMEHEPLDAGAKLVACAADRGVGVTSLCHPDEQLHNVLALALLPRYSGRLSGLHLCPLTKALGARLFLPGEAPVTCSPDCPCS